METTGKSPDSESTYILKDKSPSQVRFYIVSIQDVSSAGLISNQTSLIKTKIKKDKAERAGSSLGV